MKCQKIPRDSHWIWCTPRGTAGIPICLEATKEVTKVNQNDFCAQRTCQKKKLPAEHFCVQEKRWKNGTERDKAGWLLCQVLFAPSQAPAKCLFLEQTLGSGVPWDHPWVFKQSSWSGTPGYYCAVLMPYKVLLNQLRHFSRLAPTRVPGRLRGGLGASRRAAAVSSTPCSLYGY